MGKHSPRTVLGLGRAPWCVSADAGSAGTRESLFRGGEALEPGFYLFGEFLSLQISPDPALGVSYPDGGLPSVGSLTQLPRDGWRAFEAEFLRPLRA
jgi:hypothetical protein